MIFRFTKSQSCYPNSARFQTSKRGRQTADAGYLPEPLASSAAALERRTWKIDPCGVPGETHSRPP